MLLDQPHPGAALLRLDARMSPQGDDTRCRCGHPFHMHSSPDSFDPRQWRGCHALNCPCVHPIPEDLRLRFPPMRLPPVVL